MFFTDNVVFIDGLYSAVYSRPNCLSPGYIQNPQNVREAILRDLELERRRIREQLVVASDAHKLMMEAGLRIELSLERQMAIVRSHNFPSISGSNMKRYDAKLSTIVPCGVRSVNDKLGPSILEMNPTPEFSNEKFEVTFRAKTQEVFCGAKRKAETPSPEVSCVPYIPSAGAKKNRKREWSCALCKLSFPNVQMLNDHVQGREHCAAFGQFRLVSEEYNHPVKIVKSNGDHGLEQNADESKKKIGKELTSHETLNIDDSRKENGNSSLQMLKLTNNSKKFMTLSGGVDHENVMNDNRRREKISGDFVEVAQTGGVYADKACTHEKETNNASSEIAATNYMNNLEQVIQNFEELKKENGGKNESAEAVTQIIDDSKKINGNSMVQMLKLCYNDEKFIAPSTSQNDGIQVGKTGSVEQETTMISPTKAKDMHKLEQAKAQDFCFGAKRKADIPPEVSGGSEIPSASANKNRKTKWSCALCKLFNFPNMQMFNYHVQGTGHREKFRWLRLVSEEDNHAVKIVKAFHELKQNADRSYEGNEKEATSQATLNIDDSNKENENSAVQMLKLSNSSKKFMTLSGGHDHENAMNDNRTRELISREFVEVAQNGGVYVEKASANKKETNNTSSEIALTNADYNLEQLQKHASGAKRKAETQPLEVVSASKLPSAGAKKKNPKQEFSCRPCGLFQVVLSNDQINEHMQGMNHKAAELGERFGTRLVPKDNNNRVKTSIFSCNCNLDQVSEKLKKVTGEKNKSAEAATQIIDDSRKGNGNSAVQQPANSNEKFMAPPTSQNGGSQVEKTFSGQQETTKISTTKDKDIHKLEQANPQGDVSGFKHKAETQPLKIAGESKIASASAKKKLKQEFSCALCQVVVPTEIMFNGHIQGKRHKAAERRKLLVIGSVPTDNNSFANIAEEGNNRMFVWLNKNEKEIKEKNESANIAEKNKNCTFVWVNKDEKEIKEKNELAEGWTQDIDYSKKEIGSSGVKLLKLATNNEKVMSSSTVLEVESENEKTVDDHKRRQNQSVEFRGVAQNGGSLAEKAFSEEGETTKISSEIVGSEDKDNHKLVQAIQYVDGSKSRTHKQNASALQMIQNTHHPEKVNSIYMEKDLKNGDVDVDVDVDVNLNYVHEIGAQTEEVAISHNRGIEHLEMLVEDFQSGLPEETNFMEKETKAIYFKMSSDHCNSKKAISQGYASGAKRKAETSPPEVGGANKIPSFGAKKKLKQNADDSRKEVGEKNELVFQAMADIEPLSTLEGNIHLSGKRFEVAHSGGSHAEQEKNKVSANIGGTKDGPSLEQGKGELYSTEFLLVGSNCGSQGKKATSMKRETNSGTNNIGNSVQKADESEQEVKGESESQLFQNIFKSEKETNNLTEKTLKIGDGKKRFKFMCKICKVGSNTERVMITHNSKQRHLEKLRERAENDVSICAEKAADGVPEHE